MATAQAGFIYVALGEASGVGRAGGGYPERLLARLRRAGRDARLVNLCETGATSVDVLEDEAARVPAISPSLITLSVGTNDLLRGVPEEAFAYNLEAIASRIARARAPVVIGNIPDLSLAPIARSGRGDAWRPLVESFNEHLEATAMRHGFLVADLFEMSQEELPGHPEYFEADGLRTSPVGCELWARAFWSRVEAALEGRAPEMTAGLH